MDRLMGMFNGGNSYFPFCVSSMTPLRKYQHIFIIILFF